MAELAYFFIGELEVDLGADAVAYDIERAEADIVDPVFAVHHGGDGHCGVYAAEYALADMADGYRNGIEGSALARNDSAAGLFDILFDFVKIKHGVFDPGRGDEALAFGNGHIGNIGNRPRDKGRIAVFAEHIGVNVALVDVIIFGKPCAETRGIEDGARTDNMVFGEPGIFMENICEYIDGVAHDDVERIGRILRDLGNDHLGDIDIRLCKLEPGLAGLSCDTGCEYDDIRAGRIAVIAGVYRAGAAEGRTLADVKRFAESLFFVDVYHDDLGCETHDSKRISDRGADASGADNGYFVHDFLSRQCCDTLPCEKVEFRADSSFFTI